MESRGGCWGQALGCFRNAGKTFIPISSKKIYQLSQGKNKIWYAGVSASYESVRSVVSYNNRLLKQMVPRGQYKTSSKPLNGQVSPSGFQRGKGQRLSRIRHDFVSWHFVALFDVVLIVVILTKVFKTGIDFVTFVYSLQK